MNTTIIYNNKVVTVKEAEDTLRYLYSMDTDGMAQAIRDAKAASICELSDKIRAAYGD